MPYKDLESRKEKIRAFIRKNPRTTYREIWKRLRICIEKVYKGGMREAFEDAGVKLPRNFERKTKEERKRIIIEYIRRHPKVGGHTLRKDTKINFSILFENIKEAFEKAGIEYPRSTDLRSAEEKKKEIIKLVKENPLITITELTKRARTKPYSFFRSIRDIYKQAGIKKIWGKEKIKFRKRLEVINFIKSNPFATQREINKACKTHVQELFENGIFEAYKKAGIKFPYRRIKLHGIVLKNIKQRARNFEDKIAAKLIGYGKVNRLIKTKRGFADIILERKSKKAIIEVKDYRAKDISISQIRQLNKYLEDCSCNLGILICHTKPKKDNFLIGNNRIFLLDNSELAKIPELIDGAVS